MVNRLKIILSDHCALACCSLHQMVCMYLSGNCCCLLQKSTNTTGYVMMQTLK